MSAFGGEGLAGIVWLSLRVGLVATLATLPVAFALAFVLARARFPGKGAVALQAVYDRYCYVHGLVGWQAGRQCGGSSMSIGVGASKETQCPAQALRRGASHRASM